MCCDWGKQGVVINDTCKVIANRMIAKKRFMTSQRLEEAPESYSRRNAAA
jgi:hypothetical protein